MKKILFYVVSLVLLLILLSGCFENPELNAEEIYKMAKDAGYEGTLEEFIAEFKGEDGDGIKSVSVDEENRLTVVLDSGAVIDCGIINVSNGRDGRDGTSVTIGANGNWIIDGVDSGVSAYGAAGKDGANGKDGVDGKDGKDGASWQSGAGVPESSLGKNGDLYLDTNSFDLYKKSGGTWAKIGNFVSGNEDKITVNQGDNININISGEGENMYAAAAKGMLSSVIINAYGRSGSATEYGSGGSGIIYKLDKITGDAYIITNYHVVYAKESVRPNKIADTIEVLLYGYENTESVMYATYVGGSLNHDIAVLKISGSRIMRESEARAVELGDSDAVKVLDKIIAIGNAEGLGFSATLGAVSVDVERLEMYGADESTMVALEVFRTDAAVNHGNSGGGAFNSQGELIGIVNAKLVDESVDNIGYFIPVSTAVSVADNIISFCNETIEKPQKITLGIQIITTNDGLKYNEETGEIERVQKTVIDSVNQGALAYGKLYAGDVILSFMIDGAEYEIDRMYKLTDALLKLRTGSDFSVKVLRGESEETVNITFAANDLNPVE